MFKGYSRPFTPNGKGSLVTPTPHHYGGDYLTVSFRADERAISHFLPPGLEPAPGGRCSAFVADYVCVGADNPDLVYDDPEWTQYQEGAVSVNCLFNGRPGRFNLSIWTTQDWSVMYGWFVGWSKKIARVHLTRIHDVNPALKPVGPGTRLRGVVDRHGYRLLDISVELQQREEKLPSSSAPLFMVRHFPGFGEDVPAVSRLIATGKSEVFRTADIWSGTGTIRLGDSDNEELTLLEPMEILGGYYYKRGWTTTHTLEVLREYAPGEIATDYPWEGTAG